MLLKNYILITDEDSEEAFQQKLGVCFLLDLFLCGNHIPLPSCWTSSTQSFGKKCTVAATISVGLGAPALYEVTGEGTPRGYWGLGSDEGKAGCERAGSGEAKTWFWSPAGRGAAAAAGQEGCAWVRWGGPWLQHLLGLLFPEQESEGTFWAGSPQTGARGGFPCILVVAFNSCAAPCWCWGKLPNSFTVLVVHMFLFLLGLFTLIR